MLRNAPLTLAIGVLIAVSSLYWIGTGWLDWAAFAMGFIPVRVGGEPPYMLTDGTLPVWATPMSATLVHGGVLHLGANLLMLLFAGTHIERPLGASGVAILCLLGGYAAAAAHWMVDPNGAVPLVGASGAISALIGAYSLLFARRRTQAIGPIPGRIVHAAWLIAAWAALNLLLQLLTSGSAMPIAGVAHIGGFVVGVLLAQPLLAARWHAA